MPSLPTGRPLGAPTSTLSPAQAAQWAKVSRRTIMRAIEAQELPAFRDNRNRWQIVLQELEKWANAQWAPSGQRPPDTQPCPLDVHASAQIAKNDTAHDLAAARLTIAQLEVRLEERAALVCAAEARAQAAEALAQKLADLLAARAAPEPAAAPSRAPLSPPRRGWFWRRS